MKRKKPALWSIVIATLMVLWFIAFIFAPFLAAWVYGVEQASRDQTHMVKLVLAVPVAVPLLLFLLWGKLNERRAIRASMRTALYGAKLVDPSRERRLDIDRD